MTDAVGAAAADPTRPSAPSGPLPASSPTVLVVGRGRAGGSFAGALRAVGCDVELVAGSEVATTADRVAVGADLVLLCVPDAHVASVARQLDVGTGTVVAHCAGSLGLAALAPHERVATLHPMVALPDPDTGARRLRDAWFATSGDPIVQQVVESLGGRRVDVPDDRRALHHAAAVVASNHLVALMGQVERIAELAGVPLEAYLDLAAGALANTVELGPTAALTGPVRRGDWDSVRRHLAALPPDERAAYTALAEAATRLVPDP